MFDPSAISTIGLVDSQTERRAKIPRFLSENGLVALPFETAAELESNRTISLLVVADEGDAIEQLAGGRYRQAAIVAYAEQVDSQRVVAAARLGVADYIEWPRHKDRLLEAIRAANSQNAVKAGDALLQRSTPAALSSRERQILDLIESGCSTDTVASQLGITPSAVRTHTTHISQKTRRTVTDLKGGMNSPADCRAGNVHPVETVRQAIWDAPVFALTRREAEILALVCRGISSSAIAEQLGLSTRTVDHHRSSILRKYGVKNTAQAVQVSLRLGLGQSGYGDNCNNP